MSMTTSEYEYKCERKITCRTDESISVKMKEYEFHRKSEREYEHECKI